MNDSHDKELDNIDYSQLRKHVRYNISSVCTIINLETNARTSTVLTTISVGGISFVFPEIIPAGTILRIEFDMPNGSKVNKYIEVKRFNREFHLYQSPIGVPCNGFEHGSKFILLNKDGEKEEIAVEVKKEVIPEKPIEEVFNPCLYHIEIYRNSSEVLKHGYVIRMGRQHLYFNTLAELYQGEKIKANIVIIEDNKRAEESLFIEVNEVTKEGKLYSVKGLQVK
jgi:hypothetical protein